MLLKCGVHLTHTRYTRFRSFMLYEFLFQRNANWHTVWAIFVYFQAQYLKLHIKFQTLNLRLHSITSNSKIHTILVPFFQHTGMCSSRYLPSYTFRFIVNCTFKMHTLLSLECHYRVVSFVWRGNTQWHQHAFPNPYWMRHIILCVAVVAPGVCHQFYTI